MGNGDGSFGAASHYPIGNQPDTLALGDFNGDGNLDAASSIYVNGGPQFHNIVILLGAGDGTFSVPQPYVPTRMAFHELHAADLNGDGHLDFVGPTFFRYVGVHLGSGDGTFSETLVYGTDSDPWDLDLADWNGDCDVDLAVATRTLETIQLLENQLVP